MKRTSYFHDVEWLTWPELKDIEPYFLGGPARQWASSGGNDNWGFTLEHVPIDDRSPLFSHSNVMLTMTGIPDLGVTLQWDHWDIASRTRTSCMSKGDQSALFTFVRNLHCDPMSVGFFIPFETAWPAVKEFLETDGKLPTAIEWVNSRDVPPEAFPLP